MKKKGKPTRKQTHQDQDRRRSREAERKRRQAAQQAEEQLWCEMEPLLADYNLDDDDEEWYTFASHVMYDSSTLYEEPEFADLAFPFDPAGAMHALLFEFDLHVPDPDGLDRLPDEEREEVVSEAQINAVTKFVEPKFQRAMLVTLAYCRRRLKREKQTDKLALAAATEMLLRNDSRPVIWAMCGILHKAFSKSLDEAFTLEQAVEDALKPAQAIQPDVAEVQDLEEGSPAYEAFWKAVEKTPGLPDYLDRQAELEEERLEMIRESEDELAGELFDPDEMDQFFGVLVERSKTQGIDLDKVGDLDPTEKHAISQFLETRLPEAIRATFSPERFQEVLEDLEEIIETEDESDPRVQTAQLLHTQFSEDKLAYWENPMFGQFCINSLMALALEEAEESFDDEIDDEFDDQDEDNA
jgi:hypothetical protein